VPSGCRAPIASMLASAEFVLAQPPNGARAGAICTMLESGMGSAEQVLSNQLAYPPPELLHSCKLVRQSDIWNVGCCLVEMLAPEQVCA
jgi:serine/threonine protein kinase